MAGQPRDGCVWFAFFGWMAGPSVRSFFSKSQKGRAGSVICVCTIRHCNLYFGPFSVVSGGKQSIGWEGKGAGLGWWMGGHKHKRIVCCLLSISIDFGMSGLGLDAGCRDQIREALARLLGVRVVDNSIFRSIAPALSRRGHKKKEKNTTQIIEAVVSFMYMSLMIKSVFDLIEGYRHLNPAILAAFATACTATPFVGIGR